MGTTSVAICLIIGPTSVIVPSGFKEDILAIANAGIFKLIFLNQKLFYFWRSLFKFKYKMHFIHSCTLVFYFKLDNLDFCHRCVSNYTHVYSLSRHGNLNSCASWNPTANINCCFSFDSASSCASYIS